MTHYEIRQVHIDHFSTTWKNPLEFIRSLCHARDIHTKVFSLVVHPLLKGTIWSQHKAANMHSGLKLVLC